ncbi:MAG: DNA polymerase III subunit delta' [Proteobacteria bacterium]|nr:DNA polymerase III subunit delta' [Pseudomonadota bacterium]
MPDFKSTPGFASILGQQKPVRLLTTLLRNGTIPHAILFTGIEGVGKLSTAMAFAMACNCLSLAPEQTCKEAKRFQTASKRVESLNPCGSCKSCRKIISNNHPDIIKVEPSGAFIKIEQIRTLCHTLAMKPFEARLRVVILSGAQAMTAAAGNALLKVLEEPPDRTILILTARQTSELLPTIVSRCQHIRFHPILREHLEPMLIEKQGASADEASIIATMANGSFAKAFSMIAHKNRINWINRRNWLIHEVDALPSKPIGSALALAAKLSKNKEWLTESLEIIKSYLRDLVIYKYYPKKIMNRDLGDQIQRSSQKMAVASLLSKINDIQSAQKEIQTNTNLRLALEVLAMRLAKL